MQTRSNPGEAHEPSSTTQTCRNSWRGSPRARARLRRRRLASAGFDTNTDSCSETIAAADALTDSRGRDDEQPCETSADASAEVASWHGLCWWRGASTQNGSQSDLLSTRSGRQSSSDDEGAESPWSTDVAWSSALPVQAQEEAMSADDAKGEAAREDRFTRTWPAGAKPPSQLPIPKKPSPQPQLPQQSIRSWPAGKAGLSSASASPQADSTPDLPHLGGNIREAVPDASLWSQAGAVNASSWRARLQRCGEAQLSELRITMPDGECGSRKTKVPGATEIGNYAVGTFHKCDHGHRETMPLDATPATSCAALDASVFSRPGLPFEVGTCMMMEPSIRQPPVESCNEDQLAPSVYVSTSASAQPAWHSEEEECRHVRLRQLKSMLLESFAGASREQVADKLKLAQPEFYED